MQQASDIRECLGSPLGGNGSSLVDFAHQAGRSFVAGLTRDEQKAAGQFMTPPKIAKFMAQRLVRSVEHPHVRLLEPSAGGGILLAAAIAALLEKQDRPAIIEALLYEQDQRLIPALESLCQRITDVCAAAGVQFKYVIRGEDFLLSELALRGEPVDGLLTIANPPFFKLNKATDERTRRHGYAVYGQPNVYGLFMAATARLTPANGRWCFIAPRSWMNGQYFKAVRHTMLRHLMVDSLHAFESRRDSFEEDAVLQETVIVWATGRAIRENGFNVLFTRSQGMSDLDQALVQAVPAERIVADDEHATVTLPSEGANLFDGWSATLATYGLKVSTGPVIAFRCKEFISTQGGDDTVPLLWMQHVGQQEINWPINKKMEHVRATAANAWTLVPNTPMVIMRRFSPKEDQRRVTCAPYTGLLPGAVIGLENHLNYIHRPNGRMTPWEVRGLSALLASSVVDAHLRAIAGSTQINASELRALPLPPLAVIEAIGRRVSTTPSLEEIDEAVEAELDLTVASRKAA
ncbi:MAG: Eco57I restriction-modification methylase domain-containing protein [Cutibacterium acnes]|jgi:adenine-specific DNA-methyltransferase|nr:Eco57I restriction-modification methylase domain-containing protein [Cutibacterium acnes]